MAFPVGVVTCTLTFGSVFDWSGLNASVSVTVVPTHTLVWTATGQVFAKFPLVAVASEGMPAQVVVPVVDQDGFVDADGNDFTMWAYVCTIKFAKDTEVVTVVKNVQPLVGQTTIDVDLVPDGAITLPVSAPIPPVISVNGMTGVVVVDGGGGGGAVDSVNGDTGVVVLDAADVGADPAGSAATAQAVAVQRANHTGAQAVSTVTGLQAALDAKAPLASPTFTGTVAGVTKSHVGLANVDNTSDANKPVSTAQAAADTAVQAFAIQRANHSGAQAISTITGLQTALDAKADATDLTAKLDVSTAPELIRDTMGTALVAGTNVTITPTVTHVRQAAGGTWPARPTADTAVLVIWRGYAGRSEVPPGALDYDVYWHVD
jgi:translation initiation factor 1 (eIF-1/SUI1)